MKSIMSKPVTSMREYSNNPNVDELIASPSISLQIFVTDHCTNCQYSYEIADIVRRDFPEVNLEIVNMADPSADIPDVVFATPTYLLNGRVCSLGNPSHDQVQETFGELIQSL